VRYLASDHFGSTAFDETLEVGKRSSLTDKIIDEEVPLLFHLTAK
jgi:hypothetical protein